MRTCNCVLPYLNPDACKHCNVSKTSPFTETKVFNYGTLCGEIEELMATPTKAEPDKKELTLRERWENAGFIFEEIKESTNDKLTCHVIKLVGGKNHEIRSWLDLLNLSDSYISLDKFTDLDLLFDTLKYYKKDI